MINNSGKNPLMEGFLFNKNNHVISALINVPHDINSQYNDYDLEDEEGKRTIDEHFTT